MYIQRKHSKSSRIHIVYWFASTFLSCIQCVYDEKILQIRAYTIFQSATKSFVPETWEEENQHGVKFEASCKHCKAVDEF